MAEILRSEGIVLKTYDFRETSRIITFFSKDFGRLKLLAKGIKKPGSRFGASLELFTHSSVIFYKRETKEIYTVSDSQIIHSFDRLRSNLTSFAQASSILSFLSGTTPAEEPHTQLFALSLSALRLLEGRPEKVLLWGYFIKALALLGYSPEFTKCVECGKPSNSTRFSIDRGGVLCMECQKDLPGLNLSRATISVLKNAQERELKRLVSLKPSSSEVDEIDRFFRVFIQYHLNLEVSFRGTDESWLFK
jgi:DNA repair protein RecO (recombination protein O)